jgi:hypothetical protein
MIAYLFQYCSLFLYRGHAIDVSYQVSLHLAEGFQRRRLKCEKLTDDKTTDAKWWLKLTLPLARWAKNGHVPIATDAFMWRFYCWIFLGFKFTWSHIYFSTVVFCGTCPFLAHLAKGNVSWGHAIDASYQVSVHLAKWFQRRRFF